MVEWPRRQGLALYLGALRQVRRYPALFVDSCAGKSVALLTSYPHEACEGNAQCHQTAPGSPPIAMCFCASGFRLIAAQDSATGGLRPVRRQSAYRISFRCSARPSSAGCRDQGPSMIEEGENLFLLARRQGGRRARVCLVPHAHVNLGQQSSGSAKPDT